VLIELKQVQGPSRANANVLQNYLSPCSPGDQGAVEKSWMDVSADELLEPQVSFVRSKIVSFSFKKNILFSERLFVLAVEDKTNGEPGRSGAADQVHRRVWSRGINAHTMPSSHLFFFQYPFPFFFFFFFCRFLSKQCQVYCIILEKFILIKLRN